MTARWISITFRGKTIKNNFCLIVFHFHFKNHCPDLFLELVIIAQWAVLTLEGKAIRF
jgi:hypothetical protein